MSKPLQLFSLLWICACVVELFSFEDLSAVELRPPGFRPLPLGVHALVGGKVVTSPGHKVEEGTIIIRDDLIKAVGKDLEIPADARIWDMKGKVIYAGFIDCYLLPESTNAPVSTADTEPISSASLAASGVNFYGVGGASKDAANRAAGYEVSQVTP